MKQELHMEVLYAGRYVNIHKPETTLISLSPNKCYKINTYFKILYKVEIIYHISSLNPLLKKVRKTIAHLNILWYLQNE